MKPETLIFAVLAGFGFYALLSKSGTTVNAQDEGTRQLGSDPFGGITPLGGSDPYGYYGSL